ncbi:Molybdopterin synthase sulfur carrier subunit [bacterium HR40]|nr:Molybdopterin synthase sulfur carrier subunit [bacterium HR40]
MRIRYFAWLRQRTGCAEEEIPLPPGVRRLSELKLWLANRHPRLGEALAAKGVVRCAVNQDYVAEDIELSDDDEVAFFPPVTGG